MTRWRAAVLGGLVGTVTMLVLFALAEAEARFRLGIGTLLARYVGLESAPLVGLVGFFLVGVLLWPSVFVLADGALERLPYGADPAIRGLLFGALLWVAFVLVTRPRYVGAITVLTYGYTLFAHLVYGFALGAVSAAVTPTPTRA